MKTCLYTLRNTFAGRCKRRKQTVATANGIKKKLRAGRAEKRLNSRARHQNKF
nr:MAG TPA_asm: hypothetical protein [Caudoviricetes sp.]